MKTLLQIWLELIEENEKPGMYYDKSAQYLLDALKERYHENKDCVFLMRAFNEAEKYNLPVPEWVIDGLDSDKRFKKYRPWGYKQGEHTWLKSYQVIERWNINDATLAEHIISKGLGYYIKSGKWLSKAARAILKKGKINFNGWTWIDASEITPVNIVDNLKDLYFSLEDVVEFEKKQKIEALSGSQKKGTIKVKDSKKIPLPVIEEIKKIRESGEIEEIYKDAIVYGGTGISTGSGEAKGRLDDVLAYYDEENCVAKFKYIDRDVLDKEEIYSLSSTVNPRRQIIGDLLQAYFRKKKPYRKKYYAAKLFKEYNKNK
jgi:hypothetical protein